MATSLVLTDVESLRRAISETKDANKRKDGEIERLKATLAKMAEKSMPKEAPVVLAKESSKAGSSVPSGKGNHEPFRVWWRLWGWVGVVTVACFSKREPTWHNDSPTLMHTREAALQKGVACVCVCGG